MAETNKQAAPVKEQTAVAETEAAQTALASDSSFIVPLRRPVTFYGETITELDLSRLKTMTVADGYKIEGYVLQRSDARREPTVFNHRYYNYFLAHMVSGQPIELFEGMPTRTRLGIFNFIDDYIGIEDGMDVDAAVLELFDPFMLGGKQVTKLDLSGLDDIGGNDEVAAENYAKRRPELREYVKLGRVRQHPAYIHYLVGKALGSGPEALEALSYRDDMRLRLLALNFWYA